MAAAAAAAAAKVARGAPADTDGAAVAPDGAAGIQWAKTAAEDNEFGGRATEEASVLWDLPVKTKNF